MLPYVFAVTTGFQVTKYIVAPHTVGFDARLYASAARAWLEGGDPWRVSDLGVFFGAPPPTLILFAPFAYLSGPVVTAFWIVALSGAAVLAIRSLRLPFWWLFFWPIVDSVLISNPDVLVLCLLVVLGGRMAVLATVVKVYAIAPLIGEGRARQVALAAGLMLASVPILPWAEWLAGLPEIAGNIESASGTTSVYGNPIAMLLGVVALLALGVRRAGWLAVPVLWPHTQTHYMAMSVPMLTPLMAIAWSFHHPLLVLASVIAAAIGQHLSGPPPRSIRKEPAV